MAPTVLETTKTIIMEYSLRDWRDEETAKKLASLLGLVIGEYCESLGRTDEMRIDSYLTIRDHLEHLKECVSSRLTDDAVALARFTGMINALDMVVLSLGTKHDARLKQEAMSKRLTPKIAPIQNALREGYEPESMEVQPRTVRQICEILEYDIDGIHFLRDVVPTPNSYYASHLQLDLMWFADNGHIDKVAPHAIGWTFVDKNIP